MMMMTNLYVITVVRILFNGYEVLLRHLEKVDTRMQDACIQLFYLWFVLPGNCHLPLSQELPYIRTGLLTLVLASTTVLL
jgi:hypothetical protein